MITHCLVCNTKLLSNLSCESCLRELNISAEYSACCFKIKNNVIKQFLIKYYDKYYYMYQLDGFVFIRSMDDILSLNSNMIVDAFKCDASVFIVDDEVSKRVTKLIEKLLKLAIFK